MLIKHHESPTTWVPCCRGCVESPISHCHLVAAGRRGGVTSSLLMVPTETQQTIQNPTSHPAATGDQSSPLFPSILLGETDWDVWTSIVTWEWHGSTHHPPNQSMGGGPRSWRKGFLKPAEEGPTTSTMKLTRINTLKGFRMEIQHGIPRADFQHGLVACKD